MPIIEACVDGSEFWSNKIRMQYRGKDDNQVGFCNNFKAFLVELMAYVKEHHTTGLSWNPRGIDASAYKKEDGTASEHVLASPRSWRGGVTVAREGDAVVFLARWAVRASKVPGVRVTNPPLGCSCVCRVQRPQRHPPLPPLLPLPLPLLPLPLLRPLCPL